MCEPAIVDMSPVQEKHCQDCRKFHGRGLGCVWAIWAVAGETQGSLGELCLVSMENRKLS